MPSKLSRNLPKSSQEASKIDQNWSLEASWKPLGNLLEASWNRPGAIWELFFLIFLGGHRFGTFLGASWVDLGWILDGFWSQKSSQIDKK